jgi:hypothetical protein
MSFRPELEKDLKNAEGTIGNLLVLLALAFGWYFYGPHFWSVQ